MAATSDFTIGHSTRTVAGLVALLHEVDVRLLVDVRSIPRSRAVPQFNADTLPDALAVETRCAIMCAEAVWWRCHRRIIAD